MKSLLVLVVLHVLKAFLMVSSVTNINTCNSTGNATNGQIYLKYQYNMNILKILWNTLVNYMWKMIMWKCAQYPQVKGLKSVLVVQIFNKESTSLENKIIRILQNIMMINAKQFNKNSYTKTPAMNMSTYNSNQMEKKIVYEKKVSIFFKKNKNNSVLETGEVTIIRTPPLQTMSTIMSKYKIQDIVRNKLFLIPRIHQHRAQPILFAANLLFQNLAAQTLIVDSHNFASNFEIIVQNCNVKLFFFTSFFKKPNNKKIYINHAIMHVQNYLG
ncbi:hypothetical protein RFI_32382 [Reticulomyxa filosa]|uniref:Uncharacterized protein n=1 Tax=Reticulomyxa filosa TaxID=46433 RepID=X6LWB7_RETFI|nr:hypothetical protein RFI_32382 [Reticulomyxa filosa]|eukprot:ETO05015.1 hypothetical protein RFI_32382 [Reticulomyxa filosa]